MLTQKDGESRAKYLSRVIAEFMDTTCPGSESIRYDYAECDGLCLAEDVGNELLLLEQENEKLKADVANARDFTFECAARMVEGRLRDSEDGDRLNHEIRKIAAVIRDKGWQLRFITDCESLEKSESDLRSPESDLEESLRRQ